MLIDIVPEVGIPTLGTLGNINNKFSLATRLEKSVEGSFNSTLEKRFYFPVAAFILTIITATRKHTIDMASKNHVNGDTVFTSRSTYTA